MQTTLTAPTSSSRSRLGSLGWIWQAVTGALLVGLGGLHMVAHHFVVEGGLRDFAAVQDYIRNPLIWPLELLFLVSAVWHAILGLQAILLDLGLPDGLQRSANRALVVVGLVAVLYGIWLTYTIVNY
jgi:succinate dehydrogenase / fumarate reductase membrane anchor subunit